MRRVLKFFFHQVICQLLLFSGAGKLLQFLSSNKRLIVMYHGVRKNRGRINGRHITANQFEQQLRYFSRHYKVVSLEEICSMKQQGIAPERNTIALTFDDGFLNNITVAVPLLIKYQMPATFFVCSAGIEEKNYFHPTDLLDLLRTTSKQDDITIGHEKLIRKEHQLFHENGQPVYQYINSLSLTRWEETLKLLHDQCDQTKAFMKIDPELYVLADKHLLRSLPSTISIGSHSHYHHNLLALTPGELRQQLEHSKNILERHITTVRSFAFPYGYFDRNVVQSAKKAGYVYLIAGGDVAPEYSADVFPRIGILDGAGFAYTMLSISKGFKRFGF